MELSDFRLGAFSWLMNRYWDHPLLTAHPDVRDAVVASLTLLPLWYWRIIYSL